VYLNRKENRVEGEYVENLRKRENKEFEGRKLEDKGKRDSVVNYQAFCKME
jgi:hypothetical protein